LFEQSKGSRDFRGLQFLADLADSNRLLYNEKILHLNNQFSKYPVKNQAFSFRLNTVHIINTIETELFKLKCAFIAEKKAEDKWLLFGC
jgi:hypothetical protein